MGQVLVLPRAYAYITIVKNGWKWTYRVSCLLHRFTECQLMGTVEARKPTVKFKRRTEKIRMTKATVAALEPPATGERWVYCDRTPRLAVVVRASGERAWYWVGRFRNRMIRYKLGGFPEITPEAARRLAQKGSMQVANDEDPRAERRAERTGNTLGDLFNRYLENESKPHKRTWDQDQQLFKCYCGPLKNRRVATLTKEEIRELINKVGKKTPVAANRTLSLLQGMFRYGELDPNPARGIRKFNETSRERFLSAEELPRFLDALEHESQREQDYFRVLLCTGARSSNVAKMRWEHVNLESQIWNIPRSEFKNGKPAKVYLRGQALEISKRRKSEATREWVFLGRPGSKNPWIARPRGAWLRILDRAKIEDLTPHNLRRSLGSWLAANGESLVVIGKILGHANLSSTQIYARLSLDSVKGAVDETVSTMLEAANDKGDDDGEA